ncbi:MAG: glycoside hydrolase TIM-barrel-like domain-containing protein [Rhodobacteraceae bacterium]|nr:glycoside hydrolase TIM-barrel-like domain-containing protein [Paracoccaceae bacterium]
MATIVLGAVGAAIGSSVGGAVAGLSAAVVGRFVGSTVGRAIDQRLMGEGSEALETGRLERLRLTGVGEGSPLAQVYGRMRVGGHVIWATQFEEHVTKSGGGKGAPSKPKIKSYSYSVSLALAVCEGEITGVNRVWADGAELPLSDLNMRVHTGSATQQPDPKIEAVEGVGNVPAYRGTAYVVIEDLMLEQFGNRVPQFSFEVTRPSQDDPMDVPALVQGVAMMPGSGEYSLATEPVLFDYGHGSSALANVNTPQEMPDLDVSLQHLSDELPNCRAVSLIVSWFGDDLRCGRCSLRPKVEQQEYDGDMPWQVAGETRMTASVVPADSNGAPVYGGTPADGSVVQAIQRMAELGQDVMFYPFILMEQLADNGLEDPWTGADNQPALPWRGRITLDAAPGRAGSTDGTGASESEVDAFFGTASAADFTVEDGAVTYSGPDEWSYRRFILHNAALCVAGGGVSAFCIGSEMRALTQIRGESSFPAVVHLRALAAEVRMLLGPDTRIGYAADWSEYFGYHPQDGSGDVYFHLDPLWADDEIDFVGIDNYMPLSDWRDGEDHADAGWGSIYDLDYLTSNVAGGEGYDWYYPSEGARTTQRREPIADGAHGEPWVFRYKDLRNWWSNRHHERVGGVRSETPTDWVPQSKPLWMTELGCAAIDKGTNQPNKFLDPKSSESSLPYFSNGLRDEVLQIQYLRAVLGYWSRPENNPVSEEYGAPMVDLSRAFVWAWDARPYPWFPGNEALWSDGPNYRRGHWITGRASGRRLASVVAEICERSGLIAYDVSRLHGVVRGYVVDRVSDARRSLQPLMLAYGFDAIERDGVLQFQMRSGVIAGTVTRNDLALSDELDGDLEERRSGESDLAGRVRLEFAEADASFEVAEVEAVLPDEATHAVSTTTLPLLLTRAEGHQIAERWLAESRISRDSLRFALPPSWSHIGAGDLLRVHSADEDVLVRIDRIEMGTMRTVEAVRVEPDVYLPAEFPEDATRLEAFVPVVPVLPLFMELPLLTGNEDPQAPHLALTADPWPGSVAVFDAPTDADYALNQIFAARASIGVTETPMFAAPSGRVDRGDAVQVRMLSGTLSSVPDDVFFSGGNLFAIGDGTPDGWEVFQARDASLIGEETWLLSHRLRGQFGTESEVPAQWPVGSFVVALDGVPQQIELPSSLRDVSRHYRIGPARRPFDDPSYVYQQHAFVGIGLRPYSPVHLAMQEHQGDLSFSWVRRTRIAGDAWEPETVPLGEVSERYRVRVMQGQTVVRETQVTRPDWVYAAQERAQDGLAAGARITVAQISDLFGSGAEAEIDLPV